MGFVDRTHILTNLVSANVKARIILEAKNISHFFKNTGDNPFSEFYMEHISREKCVACTNVTGPTHDYDINGYIKRQCHPYALG